MARGVYGSYLFTEKDPAIDAMRTLCKDELGGLSTTHLKTVQENGGPVVATLDNWFNGATRKPRNESIEAAGRALGFERRWAKMPRDEFEKMLRQAARVAKEKEADKEKAVRKRARQNGHKKR